MEHLNPTPGEIKGKWLLTGGTERKEQDGRMPDADRTQKET